MQCDAFSLKYFVHLCTRIYGERHGEVVTRVWDGESGRDPGLAHSIDCDVLSHNFLSSDIHVFTIQSVCPYLCYRGWNW
jgi:hypothetical protein